MKELGGPAYLAQLTGSGAAIIGARDFAEQVYDLALLRALIGVGREMVENALDTVRVFGGYGFMTEYDVERALRDAVGSTLYSGTSDIQRNIIAGWLGL